MEGPEGKSESGFPVDICGSIVEEYNLSGEAASINAKDKRTAMWGRLKVVEKCKRRVYNGSENP